MQILVNTDHNIEGHDGLRRHVESLVEGTFGRFGERITRIEVHLTDENSGAKAGDNDKRCAMEARVAGIPPVTVTHSAGSIDQAIEGAADKLERTLDSTLERRDDHRGRKHTAEAADAAEATDTIDETEP